MKIKIVFAAAVLASVAAYFPTNAYADKLSELERKIDVLSEEMEKLKLGDAADPELKSISGFGPAASKVYQKGTKRVSVGGYGEMVYESFSKRKQNAAVSNKKDKLNFLRAVLYFGYKYNDWITFNSEIEFEHATSGKNGEVGLEMAQIDFKPWDFLGFRTGLLLMPVGLTNEFHEPTTFHGVKRPSIEQKIYPTTWRENGLGLFGKVGPLSYRTYAVTSLQGVENGSNAANSGFSASDLRNGRSKGSKSLANSWSWVGRVDYEPVEGALVGASLTTGRVDHEITESAVTLTLWDVHGRVAYRGLEAKALYVHGRMTNVGDLNKAQTIAGNSRAGNASIGQDLFGGYVELAYDVLRLCPKARGHKLSPFARYERYDTQNTVPSGHTVDPANSRIEYTFGLTYKPISQVVLKFDHQILGNQAHTGVSQTNAGIGYIF